MQTAHRHASSPTPSAACNPARRLKDACARAGDSFTHCDQVSDGETWQEFLASHIREPVKNFGVGGYSVFQAVKRMERVQAGTDTKPKKTNGEG